DFGAGGVSVAIGELTDGLVINLNAVPKKYEGLDGTEIAISESQERMAVVIAKEDIEKFLAEAAKENLEATVVADVTEEPRLKMHWNGSTIVDLSREFLNSNGAPKYTDVKINEPDTKLICTYTDNPEGWDALMANLNVCSQKGLVERFDSTIGASTVLMPFGGKYQLTPAQAMAAKIPVLQGQTDTCSVMGWGYNPFISEKSPYHGAVTAVVESIAKIVAAGGKYEHCWLTFQEYFERTQNNPERWGKPMAALLGAFKAQLEMGCGAIGGKDSMSGTFENIDVPPTLVSFAVSTASSRKITSPEFKKADSTVILVTPEYDENNLPVFDSVKECFKKVEDMIENGRASAVWTVTGGGIAEGIAKMCFGNRIGFEFSRKLSESELFMPCYGSFIIELEGEPEENENVIGKTTSEYNIFAKDYVLSIDSLQKTWESKLEPVFPCRIQTNLSAVEAYEYKAEKRLAPSIKSAKPRVLIPVFPGTNCEYDTARAFERAGAQSEVLVIKNLSASAIEESVNEAAK
ncbi:MAG: phosphoribosylformylglycinamidine synthase subunit PurQ, partial [Oscillospiraceae bacterium]|nr:phosphoribosylformylglycinamidine synthase subunit PurQ [Oscillospiraceae bacterium]